MMQDKADEAKKQSQVISSVFALVGTAAAFIPVVGPFIGPAMTIGGQIYNKYNTANQLSAPSDTVNTIIGATSIAKKSGLIGWLTS